jgi:UDP-GlcNAc:undecaprenyl-phosphate/decaprenyl-phosphate GlcNAc-1-phosphate transferase
MDPTQTAQSVQTLTARVDAVLSPYMWVFFAAFVVSFAATPVMRRLAVANGVVDEPDLKRKAHVEPVAYLGGVAIFLGWLVGVSVCLFIHETQMPIRVPFPPGILFGAAVIVFVGLIDDVVGISPRTKVGGQLIAAAALASQQVGEQMLGDRLVITTLATVGMELPAIGVDIDMLGLQIENVPAYILGTLIIAAFVLGGCNSVNLIDGLDGLAAGVCAIAMFGFLAISIHLAIDTGSPELVGSDMFYDGVRVVMCLAVIGALLGFLPYNFNPANIFMGDAGSLLLGYLCVSTILLFVHAASMGPFLVLAGLIVFALPITDTTLAIVRRKLSGQPIFSPDNQHLHHQLLRAVKNLHLGPNLSVKITVLVIYMISAVFALLGFAMVFFRARYVLAIFMVLFSFVTVMAYKLGRQQVALRRMGPQIPAMPEEPTAEPLPARRETEASEQDNGPSRQPPVASPPAPPPMSRPGVS